jgi:hypothetical protein
MTKALSFLKILGLFRAKAHKVEVPAHFEKRMQRISNVREMTAAPSAMFKNRPTPSKA